MISQSAVSEAYTDLVQREGLYYKKFSDEPFNGQLDGKVQTKVQKGYFHGSWLKFDDDGKLMEKGFHQNGKRYGTWKYFSSYGRLSYSQEYEDGILNGETKNYGSDGMLSSIQMMTDGKLTSSVNYYYQQGALKAEVKTQDSMRHGVSKWYYRNGKIKTSQNNRQGKLNGDSFDYDRFGNIESRTGYLNGQSHGYSYYYSDGKLKTQYLYEMGVLVSEEQFHENGKLKLKQEYLDGKKHGPAVEMDNEGKITSHKNYVDGELDGKFSTGNVTGIIFNHNFFGIVDLKSNDPVSCTADYVDGKLQGLLICIDKNNITRVTVKDEKATQPIFTEYDSLGRKLTETTLHHSSADTKHYYPDGKLLSSSSVSFYEEDIFSRFYSKKNGETIIYSENGEMIKFLSYKNDKLEGKILYKENGVETVVLNVIDETFFDRLNEPYSGTLELYDEKNTLRQSGSVVEGRKTGEWTTYTNNQRSKTSKYVDGRKSGVEITYFTKTDQNTKQISSNTVFDDGKKAGEFSRWFDNGQLAESGQYSDDKKTGWWRSYTKNGQIIETGRFDENGEKTGIWDYWFNDGQQKFSKKFKDGKEIGF